MEAYSRIESQEMNTWRDRKLDPPDDIGNDIVWHKVKYKDDITGYSCWWGNHWYQNAKWYEIIEWKEDPNWKNNLGFK